MEANEKVGTVVLKLLRSSASPANFLLGANGNELYLLDSLYFVGGLRGSVMHRICFRSRSVWSWYVLLPDPSRSSEHSGPSRKTERKHCTVRLNNEPSY